MYIRFEYSRSSWVNGLLNDRKKLAMNTPLHKIIDKFQSLIAFHSGTLDISIERTDKAGTSNSKAMVFATSLEDLNAALKSKAAVVVVNSKFKEKLAVTDKTILLSPNPYLALALIGQEFFALKANKSSYSKENIHPSAIIGENAKIGENTKIGPSTTIGNNVSIGSNTIIGANTTIESNTSIGDDCHIHSQVFIAHATELKNKVEVHPQTSIGTEGYGYAHDEEGNHYRIPHYGIVILEDDVHIGAGFCIDRGVFDNTVIGKGTKIDNHGHIAHNNKIGENCLITAGFIVAGSSTIGNRFVSGGRVSMQGHTAVTDDVQAAGLTVISKDIDKPGLYAGYPIQSHRDHLKTAASLPFVPELRKQVKKLSQ